MVPRRSWFAIGALAAAALAGPALAQDAPLTMFLTCTGDDVSYTQTGTKVEAPSGGARQRAAMAGLPPPTVKTSPQYGFVRRPGRLSVSIDGARVRVRPSAGTAPLRRSADGWYDLTDLSVSEDEIRARATWGLFGKLKLVIDRRSGDVKFGDFTGACEKTADTADARKF